MICLKEGENKLVRKYNKLVRDRIPEIITRKGDVCKCEILSDSEYINMLDKRSRKRSMDTIHCNQYGKGSFVQKIRYNPASNIYSEVV